MKNCLLVAGCLAGFVIVLFGADEHQPLNVKPGTWQIEYKINYSGLPPQYQSMMDQMTDQQKSAMGLAAPTSSKICVKQKDLEKPWSNDCRWTVERSTGSELDAHSSACRTGSKGTNSGMDMEIKIHAVDSENVHATMHGTASLQGNRATVDGTYVGKWLSSTCNDNAR